MKVLIVFQYQKSGFDGFNNAVVSGKEAVPSEEELLKIKRQIKKFGQYDDVVILNYIPLKED